MKDSQPAFPECLTGVLPGRDIIWHGMIKDDSNAIAEEAASFWELLAPLDKKLFNFLHKALNFSEDSSDLYQDVVIRAWKYFPSFDRKRSFTAWIFAVAHNEIKRYFKKRQAEQKVTPLELLAVEPSAHGGDPVVALILGTAMQLPPRQREVFFLFYYNKFSIAEIAAICRLRQGNVKFILSRGREAVRRALEAKHEK